jgi:hypothetical protein
MIRSRYELKYLVTEAQAVAIAEHIRPFMRPDRHSTTGDYPLCSLYLDSDDLRLCRESLEGIKNRYKLRIRTYSDEADAPCFFEIKRRVNQVIVKSRARVSRRLVGPLLSHALRPSATGCDEYRNLGQFLYYRQEIAAGPVVRVRYVRQAFESRVDDDVRVTFDRQLSLNITRYPELGLNGSGWQRLPERGVVLEVKFTRGYPAWIGRLVREFGLKTQSMSKYARLVTHACAMRFCAPVVQPRDARESVAAPVALSRVCEEDVSIGRSLVAGFASSQAAGGVCVSGRNGHVYGHGPAVLPQLLRQGSQA